MLSTYLLIGILVNSLALAVIFIVRGAPMILAALDRREDLISPWVGAVYATIFIVSIMIWPITLVILGKQIIDSVNEG